MIARKVASSAFLFSASLYILLPTPDELVIYPVLSLFFTYSLHIPFVYAIVLAMIIYRAVGCACLAGALLIGGKPIYIKLKEKITNKKNRFSHN